MSNLATSAQAPLLTVLIPTCDRWQLLAAQVRSVAEVLSGVGCSFEVVIQDNSAHPPPAGLIGGFAENVSYNQSSQPSDTMEEAIYQGWRRCRGDYVWLLGDDDGIQYSGVCTLFELISRGADDIIVFNSLRGRDEKSVAEGAFIAERAHRLFYEPSTHCTIASFVQRTGFFHGPCAISTIVVRRSAAPAAVLHKYLCIARIGAHLAWLIEIGKGRAFLFVNRPLVVRGLHLVDPDGDRRHRNVGVREGGYSNSVCTGLWLRVLNELLDRGALTLDQIRRTAETKDATRLHFGSVLAQQVLEQLGEMPDLVPAADIDIMARWLRRLSPGMIVLSALIDQIAAFTFLHQASLLRLEQDSRVDQTVRALAGDLRSRTRWWRNAISATPWYAGFYVETAHLYDVYDFGEDWVASHVSFGALREALEVIDLPSLPPAFLRAPSYAALRELIDAQDIGFDTFGVLRSSSLPLPDEWTRMPPESPVSHVHVSAPSVVVDGAADRSELKALRAELARQDAALAEAYATDRPSWTDWLRRRLAGRSTRPFALRSPPPLLELGERLELADAGAASFLPRGFSFPEAWGRWSESPIAVFRCRHPTVRKAGAFEIWPHMVWSRGGEVCMVDVRVNGEPPLEVAVRPKEPFAIPLTARTLAEPELEVVFHVRVPKGIDESPLDELRALGLGLAAVRLTVPGEADGKTLTSLAHRSGVGG